MNSIFCGRPKQFHNGIFIEWTNFCFDKVNGMAWVFSFTRLFDNQTVIDDVNVSSLSWIRCSVALMMTLNIGVTFTIFFSLCCLHSFSSFVYITFCPYQWGYMVWIWTLNTRTTFSATNLWSVTTSTPYYIHHQMHYSHFPFEFAVLGLFSFW